MIKIFLSTGSVQYRKTPDLHLQHVNYLLGKFFRKLSSHVGMSPCSFCFKGCICSKNCIPTALVTFISCKYHSVRNVWGTILGFVFLLMKTELRCLIAYISMTSPGFISMFMGIVKTVECKVVKIVIVSRARITCSEGWCLMLLYRRRVIGPFVFWDIYSCWNS